MRLWVVVSVGILSSRMVFLKEKGRGVMELLIMMMMFLMVLMCLVCFVMLICVLEKVCCM